MRPKPKHKWVSFLAAAVDRHLRENQLKRTRAWADERLFIWIVFEGGFGVICMLEEGVFVYMWWKILQEVKSMFWRGVRDYRDPRNASR